MLKLSNMDAKVGIQDQLAAAPQGPVVLVNLFTVAENDADDLVRAWTEDAAWFKTRPGFISAQLHRGVAGSCAFLNYAVWESAEKFGAAFGDPEFRRKLAAYPDTAVASPHIFQKLGVADICLA
jgi:heme-degrading monooxygenase HmoA